MFKIIKCLTSIVVFLGVLAFENKCISGMETAFPIPVSLTASIQGKLSLYLAAIRNNRRPLILERYDGNKETSVNIPIGDVTVNKLIEVNNLEADYIATYALKKDENDPNPEFLRIFYNKHKQELEIKLKKLTLPKESQEAKIFIPLIAENGRQNLVNIILTINQPLIQSAIAVSFKEILS
jgi:hypothetical protein